MFFVWTSQVLQVSRVMAKHVEIKGAIFTEMNASTSLPTSFHELSLLDSKCPSKLLDPWRATTVGVFFLLGQVDSP